jgi:hypothetical protein
MVILEINNIHVLKNVIISLYNKNDSKFKILQTKKYLDFCDWSILVCICYYGYHRLPEGISLINEIKSHMNNFRLTTYQTQATPRTKANLSQAFPSESEKYGPSKLDIKSVVKLAFVLATLAPRHPSNDSASGASGLDVFNNDIYKQDLHLPLVLSSFINNFTPDKGKGLVKNDTLFCFPAFSFSSEGEAGDKCEEYIATILSKISYLFSLPSPYEIKDGLRYLRGTNNLVSEKLKLICIDENNNRITYSSISECSKALKFGRTNIKNCILSGQTYKNYKFIFVQ